VSYVVEEGNAIFGLQLLVTSHTGTAILDDEMLEEEVQVLEVVGALVFV